MRAFFVIAALAIGFCGVAHADDDLDRIPPAGDAPAMQTAPAAPPETGRIYTGAVVSASGVRTNGIIAAAAPASWQARIFGDVRQEKRIGSDLKLVFSDRLNLRQSSQLDVGKRGSLGNDLREASASWEAAPGVFLDAGRINLKSGVALGYNPTDFFRPRSGIELDTADPSARRENRLGMVMLSAQKLWNGGALLLAYAPRLAREDRLSGSLPAPADPLLGRTNGMGRFLAKASVRLAEDVAPEFLVFHDRLGTKFGANLAVAVGQSMIAYGEFSGGVRGNLIEEAWAFAQRTGTVPGFVPSPLATGGRRFRSEAVLGLSYALENRTTLNLEYHFNEAGLSPGDWRRWFGSGAPASLLWLYRGYAGDQQQLTSRHAIFVRAERPDVMVRGLTATGFVNVNPQDGSVMAQLGGNYALSNAWTLAGNVSAWGGGRRSEYGSLRQAAAMSVSVTRDW